MRGRLLFVGGAAIGFVLGSRAGRERYEQIAAGASKLWHSRGTQRQVGTLERTAEAVLPKAVTVLFRLTLWAAKKLLGITTTPQRGAEPTRGSK